MRWSQWLYKSVFCVITIISLFGFTSSVHSASRCQEISAKLFKPAEIRCTYRSIFLPSSDITHREVLYELPVGTPPPGGWPVAIVYQGSLFPVEFTRNSLAPFGGFYELKTVKTLLDNGYAVLLPRAPIELAWLTNSGGPATIYDITTDYVFLNNVFDAIRAGRFGELNPERKYATGISSGGYNTSRMAVTWPDEFKALVVHSGSYATCLGPVCVLPCEQKPDHPPTKFIHGFVDTIVPWWSMNDYYDQLLHFGIETEQLTLPFGGHEWFPESPQAVLEWFDKYP